MDAIQFAVIMAVLSDIASRFGPAWRQRTFTLISMLWGLITITLIVGRILE
jgi:hypothetical protein